MKTGLSLKHIKKGCELVKGYSINNEEWNCLLSERYHHYIQYIDDPLYRDFLQLVIEAINKRYRDNIEEGYCIDLLYDNIEVSICWESCITIFYDVFSEIKAKEKAIAYVFNNME